MAKIKKVPVKPTPTGGPPATWSHRTLYENVIKTLYTLPEEFVSSIKIADFRATDIFTLNTALGASIEDAVVTGLNKLREVWDPAGGYSLYRFERRAQAFPDVRLVSDDATLTSPLLGIELKGWFALSKEGEPTFRYTITSGACAPQDLLVVYPWVLSDVVSGSPRLLRPYVGEALYAAELRNSYWVTMRTASKGNPRVIPAAHQAPYPAQKTDQCSDRAEDDGGGNFGRVARYGLLDTFIASTIKQEVSGIPIAAWLAFLKKFNDNARDFDAVVHAIENSFRSYEKSTDADARTLLTAFEHIVEILKSGSSK